MSREAVILGMFFLGFLAFIIASLPDE